MWSTPVTWTHPEVCYVSPVAMLKGGSGKITIQVVGTN
jgi:hypothetical protein